MRQRKIQAESEGRLELDTIKRACALNTKSDLLKHDLDETAKLHPPSPACYIDRMHSLDHPKLGTQQEFKEELRHEQLEKWCRTRYVETSELYSNKNKRNLRKWFMNMDSDGSGEVSVKELEDPLLSTGTLL
jgi:hypothetical protein